eukprot:3469058-Lingulodinium_polyedra.AAC.1
MGVQPRSPSGLWAIGCVGFCTAAQRQVSGAVPKRDCECGITRACNPTTRVFVSQQRLPEVES